MKNALCTADIVVIGGGFAGAAAAIAAARQGRKVILLEQAGFLGGAAGSNLVFPYMGYWTEKDGRRIDLSAGLFAEINRRLTEMDALHFTCFHEEYLKVVLEQMAEEAGVQLVYHAAVCRAEVSGGRIRAVDAVCCGLTRRYEADVFIDATGDANLAALAGCPYEQGRTQDGFCQPMTLCFRLGNVDKEKFYKEHAQINPLYSAWQAAGKLRDPRENMLIFDYPVAGVLHFNTTRVVRLDPTDPDDLTRAEIEARLQTLELVDFLRQNFSAFADAGLIGTAHYIGVRESRRVCGEHLLTAEELKECTVFEDAIAAGNYDIDIHSPTGSGTSHYYFAEGTWYTIPYRSLVAKGTDNLLVAGRCLSATHEAQASVRIMPICCCTGEAAGVAAAVCAENGAAARSADVGAIRARLAAVDAFLG